MCTTIIGDSAVIPSADRAELQAAVERNVQQYSHFQDRTLAVRGERLRLHGADGRTTQGTKRHTHVFEVGEDGLEIIGRFDEDDFEGAYRELERRYYAGEGEAFAEAGATRPKQ